ncbi:MAG: hypothetical protein AAFR97_15630, partial [Bacteroidota bacterium]
MKSLFVILAAGLLTFTLSCSEDDEIMIDEREKFLGTYIAEEVCDFGNDNSIVIIQSVEESTDEVVIRNLHQFGTMIFAVVSGNELSISDQPFGIPSYSGTGSISGMTITINYMVSNPFGNSGSCTVSL